jgi:cephalosporin hydroxylase
MTDVAATWLPEIFHGPDNRTIQVVGTDGVARTVDIYTPEGYDILCNLWTRSGWQQKASYEVTWLGIPIIQLSEDILMMQELIWRIRPDVIIESGVAHGGSLVLYASIQEMIGKGRVIGVDIEIRKYNRLALQSHPMSRRISLIEGDSVTKATLDRIRDLIRPGETVLVTLDSNHSEEHVARELQLYSQLVTTGSYLVVFDGVMRIVADAPDGNPAWEEHNPWRAVQQFLSTQSDFAADPYYNRLKTTYCPGGFLKRLEPEPG